MLKRITAGMLPLAALHLHPARSTALVRPVLAYRTPSQTFAPPSLCPPVGPPLARSSCPGTPTPCCCLALSAPPGDHEQLDNHAEVVMHDFAACLLGELERWMLTASPAMVDLSGQLVDSPEFGGATGALEAVQTRLYSDEVRRRGERGEGGLASVWLCPACADSCHEAWRACGGAEPGCCPVWVCTAARPWSRASWRPCCRS
jgi:hypothetical protein